MHKLKVTILGCFLYLAIAFLPASGYAQDFGEMVEYGDEQAAIGDYYHAIKWYRRAMDIDSNSVELLWKYAESLRLYKDYGLAEFYYWKVYSKELGKIYKNSIIRLATMQEYNGNYEDALGSWFKARKIFKKDLDSYEMERAKQGIKSCLWAQKAIRDTSDHIVAILPEPVNSTDSELAPFFHNSRIYFTSMKADSLGSDDQINPDKEFEEESDIDYSIKIYSAKQSDTIFSEVEALKDVQKKGYNSANGSFSPDGKRFYFSRCRDYNCKIYVGKVDGDKITDIDSLGDIINEEGFISTMPSVAMVDGKEVLFFASTMNYNYGGMDLWYSVITDGNQYSLPQSLGAVVNSKGNEITPFYSSEERRLYFSSDWHHGFGGFDLFYVELDSFKFEQEPVNLGLPINSSKNDTYPAVDDVTGRFYFSSNRDGVNATKGPNCCNDIFSAHIPIVPPPNRYESLADLNKHLPVVLYFHNDRPNPRSQDTTTTLSYMSTYYKYRGMQEEYKKEYSKGLSGDAAEDAKIDIEDFFIQYVEQGVEDLKEFLRLLIIELDKGYDVEVTIRGFASPLADTDYNVKLTRRRIMSLENYIWEHEGGVFQKYINKYAENGGRVTFNGIPFGEYQAANKFISDNRQDQQGSVYSKAAALERKIEIQSVSFVYSDSSYAKMKFEHQQHDFGYVAPGKELEHIFVFTNTGEEDLEIGSISSDCECLSWELNKKTIKPGQKGQIKVNLKTVGLSGLNIYHVDIESNVSGGKKQISVSTHIR